MYPYIAQPNSLSELHEFQYLASCGDLVELAGIGWIARDFVRTTTQRASVLARACPTGIVATHVGAYWVYTGVITLELSRSVHLRATDRATIPNSQNVSQFPKLQISRADLCQIGPLTLTTMERTVIDIMRTDLALGVEALLALLRCGASYKHVIERANHLLHFPGMRQTRELLHQLPAELTETK